jgi:hypothetical protein
MHQLRSQLIITDQSQQDLLIDFKKSRHTPSSLSQCRRAKVCTGLLGATGATGVLVLEQALAAGHTVKALARNPSVLQSHAKLTVVKGDVENQTSMDQLGKSLKESMSSFAPSMLEKIFRVQMWSQRGSMLH